MGVSLGPLRLWSLGFGGPFPRSPKGVDGAKCRGYILRSPSMAPWTGMYTLRGAEEKGLGFRGLGLGV